MNNILDNPHEHMNTCTKCGANPKEEEYGSIYPITRTKDWWCACCPNPLCGKEVTGSTVIAVVTAWNKINPEQEHEDMLNSSYSPMRSTTGTKIDY